MWPVASVRSRRFEVLRCLHFTETTRVHRTMPWVVSFSILSAFRATRYISHAGCSSRRSTTLILNWRTSASCVRRRPFFGRGISRVAAREGVSRPRRDAVDASSRAGQEGRREVFRYPMWYSGLRRARDPQGQEVWHGGGHVELWCHRVYSARGLPAARRRVRSHFAARDRHGGAAAMA